MLFKLKTAEEYAHKARNCIGPKNVGEICAMLAVYQELKSVRELLEAQQQQAISA